MQLVSYDAWATSMGSAEHAASLPALAAKAVVERIGRNIGQQWQFSIPVSALLQAATYYGTTEASFRRAITLALAGEDPYMSHEALNFLFGQVKSNATESYAIPRVRIPTTSGLLVIAADVRALLSQYESLRAVPGAIDGLMEGALSLTHHITMMARFGLYSDQVKGYLEQNNIPLIEVPYKRPKKGGYSLTLRASFAAGVNQRASYEAPARSLPLFMNYKGYYAPQLGISRFV